MNKKQIIQKLKQAKVIIDDCIANLSSSEKGLRKILDKKLAGATKINFDMSPRAFVKEYGKGMSYPKKFTLLAAFLSKGELTVEISLKSVEKLWKRMTSKDLLKGKFNRSYSTKAKTQGWIKEGKKAGFYRLDPKWTNIFKSK